LQYPYAYYYYIKRRDASTDSTTPPTTPTTTVSTSLPSEQTQPNYAYGPYGYSYIVRLSAETTSSMTFLKDVGVEVVSMSKVGEDASAARLTAAINMMVVIVAAASIY